MVCCLNKSKVSSKSVQSVFYLAIKNALCRLGKAHFLDAYKLIKRLAWAQGWGVVDQPGR